MCSIYYKCKDGHYISEYTLEEAYFIVTGKNSFDNKKKYSDWVKSILGKSIVSSHKTDDIVITKELIDKNKILAVRLYKDRNNCSLVEARKAIEAM